MDLESEVTNIKGVGPKIAASLKKNGMGSLGELFYYLPRGYEDYHTSTKIADLTPGKVVVKGKIRNLVTRYARRNCAITEGEIYDETGAIKVIWFNQPYRSKGYKEDREYYFTGNYDLKFQRYQLTSPSSVAAEDVGEQLNTEASFQPIYSAKGAMDSAKFRKIFEQAREQIAKTPDFLPFEGAPDFVEVGARADALYKVHFPANANEVAEGKKYLAYEELFGLILAAQLNKNENSKLKAFPLHFIADANKNIIDSLPFILTDAQKKAAWEILQDLEKGVPMNRLLQGDVGSGKTVVAALAAYQAVYNGAQVALLAPTAILATQHYDSLKEILEPLGVRIALLTATTKNKSALKRQIMLGNVDLVIGTHALLTDDTVFHSLALCIIDEQHRFGVMQRQKLLEKTTHNTAVATRAFAPHFLAMTATPIPRSLQLTVFGDLDVSIINQLPRGRQPITTQIISEINMRDQLYTEIREAIERKEQVYWICRLIENKGHTEAMDVKKQTERLREIFPKAHIEFLHGRMQSDAKDAIMSMFAHGDIDILVSTTVVEVGVDVPNATKIVIMDAEGFGLAQLHQLRGRVGRGSKPSSCYLISAGDTKPSKRLRELEKSTDGFYLAEVDLRIRGPGEIYGNLQHGSLNLQVASFADTELIHLAREHAAKFAEHPEELKNYPELARSIHKYQQLTTLN